MKRTLLALLLVTSALSAACVSGGAQARRDGFDYWKKNKGDCESVLSTPYAHSVDKLAHCTKIWEMYRVVEQIPLEMRSMYAVAFSKVSYHSPIVYDRAVADAALRRLCIPRHPLINGEVKEKIPSELKCESSTGIGIGGQGIQSNNPYERLKGSVRIPDATDKELAQAAAAHRRGLKDYHKKSMGRALDAFKESLSHYAYYVPAKYNLACVLARMGNDDEALKALEDLYSWDDPEAEAALIQARQENDFSALDDNVRFKLLTGYVRLILANGTGDLGMDTVRRLKNDLEERRYNVTEIRSMSKPQLVPQIWYKQGFQNYAEKIKLLIGTKKVVLEVIDYDTIDDIIVVWGQPEAAQLSGAGQAAPVVQGTRSEGSGNRLKDMTEQVKDTQSTVGDAADTARSLKQLP